MTFMQFNLFLLCLELYAVFRGVDLMERKLVIHIQLLGLQNILPTLKIKLLFNNSCQSTGEDGVVNIVFQDGN